MCQCFSFPLTLRLLASPANIRLGWKQMEVANTLAFCDMATFTAKKSFIVHVSVLFIPINFKALSLARKYQTRVEANGSCKHISLFRYGNNYGCKKFYNFCLRASHFILISAPPKMFSTCDTISFQFSFAKWVRHRHLI